MVTIFWDNNFFAIASSSLVRIFNRTHFTGAVGANRLILFSGKLKDTSSKIV